MWTYCILPTKRVIYLLQGKNERKDLQMLRMYFDNGTHCKSYRVRSFIEAKAIVSGTAHCHNAVCYVATGCYVYERNFGGWIRSDFVY